MVSRLSFLFFLKLSFLKSILFTYLKSVFFNAINFCFKGLFISFSSFCFSTFKFFRIWRLQSKSSYFRSLIIYIKGRLLYFVIGASLEQLFIYLLFRFQGLQKWFFAFFSGIRRIRHPILSFHHLTEFKRIRCALHLL